MRFGLGALGFRAPDIRFGVVPANAGRAPALRAFCAASKLRLKDLQIVGYTIHITLVLHVSRICRLLGPSETEMEIGIVKVGFPKTRGTFLEAPDLGAPPFTETAIC